MNENMNESFMLEILKGAISFGSSTVSGIVQALLTTLFLRKNTSTNEFEKIKTTEIAKAIYALLHEQGKNRKVVYIKDKKGGTNEFFFNDSVIDIFRKLTKIDEINLLKD